MNFAPFSTNRTGFRSVTLRLTPCGHDRTTSTESIRGSFWRNRSAIAPVSTEISGAPDRDRRGGFHLRPREHVGAGGRDLLQPQPGRAVEHPDRAARRSARGRQRPGRAAYGRASLRRLGADVRRAGRGPSAPLGAHRAGRSSVRPRSLLRRTRGACPGSARLTPCGVRQSPRTPCRRAGRRRPGGRTRRRRGTSRTAGAGRRAPEGRCPAPIPGSASASSTSSPPPALTTGWALSRCSPLPIGSGT